jgi:cytochrome bd-type quinol oxidase subunit 1
MGMGVAAAGAVLAAFTAYFQPPAVGHTLWAFQATFACMGLITVASAGIFWQLSPLDRASSKAAATADAADHG